MTTTNAFAAGQSGIENNLAPKSETTAPDTHIQTQEDSNEPHQTAPNNDQALAHDIEPTDEERPLDDEVQRRRVAGLLSDQIDMNVDLSGVCEHLASIPKKGRIEAIHAAARLGLANAQLARSVAQFLKIERRQITIVQHVQPRVPSSNHLNASGEAGEVLPEAPLIDELLSKFFRYMKLYADEELGPVLERAALKEKQDGRDDAISAA